MIRKLAAVGVLGLALSSPAHAVFFFFLPFSFQNADKSAIEKYEKEGDWKSMLFMSQKRLEVDPKNPGWHYLAGLSYQRMNRCSEAVPEYTKAIELKDNNYLAAAGNREICQRNLAAAAPTPPSPASPIPVVLKAESGKNVADRLRELKQLREENLITQELYEAKQKEILSGQ